LTEFFRTCSTAWAPLSTGQALDVGAVHRNWGTYLRNCPPCRKKLCKFARRHSYLNTEIRHPENY
jgi:hypothetical protein